MTDRTGATRVRCEKCKTLHEPLDACPSPKVEAATDEAIAAHRERMCDMEIEALVPEEQEYLRLIARLDAQAKRIIELEQGVAHEKLRRETLIASLPDGQEVSEMRARIKEFEAVLREASEMIRSG